MVNDHLDAPARFELAYPGLQSGAWPSFATARQINTVFNILLQKISVNKILYKKNLLVEEVDREAQGVSTPRS